jgi:hypothetical protein
MSEIDDLRGGIDTVLRVECVGCGHEEEAVGVSAYEFARQLHAQGWRDVVSNTFADCGPFCPGCLSEGGWNTAPGAHGNAKEQK